MTDQSLWAPALGLMIALAGCQLPLGVACGEGWCSDEQICADPHSAHPVCVRSGCGNGHQDPGEECDDGNTASGDGCSPNCMFELCGNGVIDPGEQCDGAAGTQPCNANCHQASCGNDFLDPGEECDDGNTVDGDLCEHDCTRPRCGNGIVDQEEQCDYGTQACGSCNENCQNVPNLNATGSMALPDTSEPEVGGFVVLGDGHRTLTLIFEYPEVFVGHTLVTLDDGASGADAAQALAPLIEADLQIDTHVVGNVIYMTSQQPGANGNVVILNNAPAVGTSGMSGGQGADCKPGSVCRLDQDCEEFFKCVNGQCEVSCSQHDIDEDCGNGIVDLCEECDDGNRADGDHCEHDCTLPRCGNGILDAKEACDDGAANSDAGPCTTACRLVTCGDGIVQAGEECDDGNHTDGDGCEVDCLLPKCGNAILDLGEECDDGNLTDADGCEHDCTLPRCGNGIVDPPEVCDDGNQDVCGSCNASCTYATPAAAEVGDIFVGSGADLQIAPSGGGNNRFTLSDDYTNPDAAVTFEYTNGTPSPGHIAIPFVHGGKLDSATRVGKSTEAAINASKLLITASSGGSDVVFFNLRSTSRSDGSISLIFGSNKFRQGYETSGSSGDCDLGIGCASSSDCISNLCVDSRCVACTTNAECASHLCSGDGACDPCKFDSDCVQAGAGNTCNASNVCVTP